MSFAFLRAMHCAVVKNAVIARVDKNGFFCFKLSDIFRARANRQNDVYFSFINHIRLPEQPGLRAMLVAMLAAMLAVILVAMADCLAATSKPERIVLPPRLAGFLVAGFECLKC